MTSAQPTRTVRRGRIFPQNQWSFEKKQAWKAERRAIRQRCQEVFERVKSEAIETHRNWYVAVEPKSGDYFLDIDIEVATQMSRSQHPTSIPFLFKINETGACGTI